MDRWIKLTTISLIGFNKKILPFYLIKYNGKTEQLSDDAVQLSFMDDSDVVIEEE